jgi:hypothetical protein
LCSSSNRAENSNASPPSSHPHAPDHNLTEHVWSAAEGAIAHLQRETPENTFSAFMNFTTSRTFDYDFEHLPILRRRSDLV